MTVTIPLEPPLRLSTTRDVMGAVSSQADLGSWRAVPPTVSALELSTPGFLPKSLTSTHISPSAPQAFVML